MLFIELIKFLFIFSVLGLCIVSEEILLSFLFICLFICIIYFNRVSFFFFIKNFYLNNIFLFLFYQWRVVKFLFNKIYSLR